jgi:hypothetical protein
MPMPVSETLSTACLSCCWTETVQSDVEVAAPGELEHGVPGVPGHLGEIRGHQDGRGLPGLGPVQLQQVGHEGGEALGVAKHRRQRRGLLGAELTQVAVGEDLAVPTDARDRGPQLVADRGDDLVLDPVGLLQSRHRLELASEGLGEGHLGAHPAGHVVPGAQVADQLVSVADLGEAE